MQRSVQSPRVDPRRQALSEEHGGTGAMTLVDAAKNLNIVTIDMLNQPSGVAGLDANSLLSNSIFPDGSGTRRGSLSGPKTVVQSVNAVYKITDFDSTKQYSLSVSAGSVSRVGDSVTITAPSSTGNMVLSLNGQNYDISVVGPRPEKPSIANPANGAFISSRNVYASASTYRYLGTPSTHQKSHWQVSSDPLFSSILAESADDPINLTDWIFLVDQANTVYYVRVRYMDSTGTWSDWSDISMFYTSSDLNIATEQAKLIASVPTESGQFGYWMSISADNTRVAISSSRADNGGIVGSGAIYIFRRTGSSWVLEQRILPPAPAANDLFGIRVSMSSDATRFVASASGETSNTLITAGVAHVYYRDSGSTVWTLEATLTAADQATGDQFGYTAVISGDGNTIFSGARGVNNGATIDVGAAYVFRRTGTTWTQQQKLFASIQAASDLFGSYLDCNYDGTVLVVGSPSGDSTVENSGVAFVFRYNGTQFVEEQRLFPNTPVASGAFGQSMCVSESGNRIVITSPAVGTNGRIHVFHRPGNVWLLEQLIEDNEASGSRNPLINADGTRIVVGIRNGNISGVVGGKVNVYDRSENTWVKTGSLSSSDYQVGDNFGFNVAVSDDGTYIFVGATGEDPGGVSNAGAVYVFS
jgi:FG-GAP repeat